MGQQELVLHWFSHGFIKTKKHPPTKRWGPLQEERKQQTREGMGWKWPSHTSGSGQTGIMHGLQPQIMKADEALAFTHMAILFRAQIIQWFQKPHSTFFEESKGGLPSPYNKQVLPWNSL